MIGITGAHRTGKSTLAQAFAEANEIPYVATSASEVFRRMGLDPKEDYPFEMRLVIQEMLLATFEAQFTAAQRLGTLFVSDRTPIDLASYLMADIQRGTMTANPAMAKLANDYVDRCLKSASRFFSVIVILQPGIDPVEAEGKAPACPAYMEHLSAIQLGLLCDERNLTRKYSIPRAVTKLEDRLMSLANAVKVAIDTTEALKKHQTFH